MQNAGRLRSTAVFGRLRKGAEGLERAVKVFEVED
jgi:hypothetical protein